MTRFGPAACLILGLLCSPALAAGEAINPVSGLPMPSGANDSVVVADPGNAPPATPVINPPTMPSSPDEPVVDRPRVGGGIRITPDGSVMNLPGGVGNLPGAKIIQNKAIVDMPPDVPIPGEQSAPGAPPRDGGISGRVRTPGLRATPDGKLLGGDSASAITPPTSPTNPTAPVVPTAPSAPMIPGTVPLGLGSTVPLPATSDAMNAAATATAGATAGANAGGQDPWTSLPNGAEAVLFGLSPANNAAPGVDPGPGGDMPRSVADDRAARAAAAPPPAPPKPPTPPPSAVCPAKTRITHRCVDDPKLFEHVSRTGPGKGCDWAVAEIPITGSRGVVRFRYPRCAGTRRQPSFALARDGRLTEKIPARAEKVVAVIYPTGDGNARARLEGIRQSLAPHIRRQCQVTALDDAGTRLAITPTPDYAEALRTLRWPGPVCGPLGRRSVDDANSGPTFLARRNALIQLTLSPAAMDRESITVDR